MWISTPAASEVLNVPASLVVHEKDMTIWLQDFAARITQPNTVVTPKLVLQQPFQSILSNISWQGAFRLDWSNKPNSNVWIFEGELQDLILYSSDLEIHDTFRQVVGGSTVNIRIDASCQNLSLNFPGGTKFHGEVVVVWKANQLKPTLQNFTLNPGAAVPIVKVGGCTGPTGMQGFLAKQVAQLYVTPAKIQPMAAAELQRLMTAKATALQTDLAKPYSFQFGRIGGRFAGTTFSNLPNGSWVIDGLLALTSKIGTQTRTLVKDYSLANLKDVGFSGAVVSKKSVADILAFARRAGVLDESFTSKAIPGFATFRQSGLQEGFVWPDLLNFPESTVFPVDFSTASDPSLTKMTNQYPSVSMDVASNVDFLVKAPTPRGELPYVEFSSTQPAQGHLILNPQDGAMKVSTSLEKMPLKYTFRKEYASVRQPHDYINMDEIETAMSKSPSNKSWTYRLPPDATPVKGYSMGFQGVVFGAKTFRFDMNFKKQ